MVIKQILLPDRESWALQGASSSSSESTENAVELRFWHKSVIIIQGPKLTFLARSRLAPKFSKVVAKAKKLGAIKKKKDSWKNALYS